MKLLPLFITLIVSLLARSQNTFQKYFSEPMEYQQMVWSAPDSTFILAGSRFNPGTVYDFCAVKVDLNGQIVWKKNYASANDEFLASASVLPDGNILFGGYKSNNNGDNDLSLLKVDSDGAPIWHKTYGNSAFEQLIFSGADISGNIIMAGNRWGGNDPMVMQTDGSGNLLWSKTYSSVQAAEQTDAAQLLNDGSTVMAGDLPGVSLFISRVTPAGSKAWAYSYSSAHTQFLNSIQSAGLNGFILASTDYRCDASGCFPFFSFIRIDSSGNVLWAKAVENALGWGRQAIPTADGGFAITGQLQDTAAGDKNPILIKVNSSGQFQWAVQYGPAGTSGETFFVKELSGGGFMLWGLENSGGFLARTGVTGLTGCSEKSIPLTLSDMSIGKSGPANLPEKPEADIINQPVLTAGNYTVVDSLICDVTSVDEIVSHLSLSCFPNPASESVLLEISSDEDPDQLMLYIRNSLGEMVSAIKWPAGSFTHSLMLHDLPSGIYFLEVRHPEKHPCTSKLIIQH